jgi:hypothetical protein
LVLLYICFFWILGILITKMMTATIIMMMMRMGNEENDAYLHTYLYMLCLTEDMDELEETRLMSIVW